MKYSNKINKIYVKYTKDFKRKDETFEMMTLKRIVKDLEEGNYDKEEYTEEQVETMCKYLQQRYLEKMYDLYKYLNSEEYKNRRQYI